MPLGSTGGRWRVAAGMLGGMALSAALVGGGYAIGTQASDDPDPVIQESAATPAVATPDQQPQQPATTVPPLTQSDEVEPVTAVARALSPSVVLINTGGSQGSGIVWDAEKRL